MVNQSGSEKAEIEPAGTYRPQFRFRWRSLVRVLDYFPRLKAELAEIVRGMLRRLFEPGMVTTERVVEYPFVFQHLSGVTGLVLDVGSCSSRLPIALASRGMRVVGIDFQPYPYRHPNLTAVRADVMNLPFATRSFGAVCAVSVIEHIGIGHYGDPASMAGDRQAVLELARILRPDGRLVLTVPFGVAMADGFQRIYGTSELRALLVPVMVTDLEFARSWDGLWVPCNETEAATVDWRGPHRAVALVVAKTAAG